MKKKDIRPFNDKMQPHGYWEVYHHTGNIYFTGNYRNGKHYGITKMYYENGNLYKNGNYINDKQSGYWEFYSLNGLLSSKEFHII